METWTNQPPRQDKSSGRQPIWSATAICICLSPSKAPKSAAENNMRPADATEIQQKQAFTCRLLDCLVSEFRWETEKVTGSCGGHRRPSHAHVVVGTTGREEYAELQWTDQLSHSHTHTHKKMVVSTDCNWTEKGAIRSSVSSFLDMVAGRELSVFNNACFFFYFVPRLFISKILYLLRVIPDSSYLKYI